MKHKLFVGILAGVLSAAMALSLTACKKTETSGKTSSVDDTKIENPWTDESSEEAQSSLESGETQSQDGTPGVSDSSTSTGNNQSKPGTPQTAKLVGNTYTSGFPICKDKTKISLMVVRSADHGDFDNMNYTKYIEQKMNIDINWILVPEHSQYERKALAFSSGNLPDVMILFSGIITNSEIAQYSSEGTLLELGSSIPAWAPNIKASIDQHGSAMASVTSPNGKIYILPSINEGKISRIWNINVKWLSNLGMSKPKTMEELRTVLRAFRDNDPDRNGKKDTIPAAFQTWEPIMWWPWGLNCNFEDNFVVTKDGKVKYAWATDEFKAGIKYWSTLYKEGLLDSGKTIDALDSYDEYVSVLKKGNVGLFSWSWPVSALGEELSAQYEPLAIPNSNVSSANFSTPVVAKRTDGAQHAVITKSAKDKLPTVLRYLDYSFTAEGQIVQTYGDTSTGLYTVQSDGKYKISEKAETTNRLTVAPGWVLTGNSMIADKSIYKKSLSEMNSYEKVTKLYQDKIDAAYKPLVKETFPQVILTAAEANSIKKYESWWNGGLRQAIPFMTGDMNVDTQWNQYYQTLLGRELTTLESVYQKAYDRVKKLIK